MLLSSQKWEVLWECCIGQRKSSKWSQHLSPEPHDFSPSVHTKRNQKEPRVSPFQALTCEWQLISVFVALHSSGQLMKSPWVCMIKFKKTKQKNNKVKLTQTKIVLHCKFIQKLNFEVSCRLASLLTMSSRSGMLTSALTRGILSTSSGKGLCLTLYLMPTSLFGVGRPSGTNTCCGRRRVGERQDDRHSYNICATDGKQQDVRKMQADCRCYWRLLQGSRLFWVRQIAQCDLTLWLARAPLGWWKSCMVHACLPAVPLMSTVTDGLGSASKERLWF